jgi:hypothetical protein
MAAITHNRTVIARYRSKAKRSGVYSYYMPPTSWDLYDSLPASYHDSYDTFLHSSTQEIEALQD